MLFILPKRAETNFVHDMAINIVVTKSVLHYIEKGLDRTSKSYLLCLPIHLVRL